MRKTHGLFLKFRLKAGSHKQGGSRWTKPRGSSGKHVKHVLCTCSAALKHILAVARNTHTARLVHAIGLCWCMPGAAQVQLSRRLGASLLQTRSELRCSSRAILEYPWQFPHQLRSHCGSGGSLDPLLFLFFFPVPAPPMDLEPRDV